MNDLLLCGTMLLIPIIIVLLFIKFGDNEEEGNIFPIIAIPLFGAYIFFVKKIFPYIEAKRTPELIISLGVGLLTPFIFSCILYLRNLKKARKK